MKERMKACYHTGKRLVGLLGGGDVHELVQSPLMGKRLVKYTRTWSGWRWHVLILMVNRLVGLLGGGDVDERVRVGDAVYSPLMGKRLVSLLGGGDVDERVRVGDAVYSPLMGKSFCKAALACLVVGMYMNLCRLEMTWVPTRVKRPKLRQSTQRMEMGGQYSSFSGSSCT